MAFEVILDPCFTNSFVDNSIFVILAYYRIVSSRQDRNKGVVLHVILLVRRQMLLFRLCGKKCFHRTNEFVGVEVGAYRFETLCRKPVLSNNGARAC